jgi:hypothetical protein
MNNEFDIALFDMESVLMPSIYADSLYDLDGIVAANDDEYPEFENLYGLPA